MTDALECPECGDVFATLEGVAMHLINKQDSEHQGYSDKYRSKRVADDFNNGGDPAGSPRDRGGSPDGSQTDSASEPTADGGEFELPEFPEAERDGPGDLDSDADGFECCADPTVTGSEGDVYRLADGTAVRLDANEQICLNCDQIHE